MPNAHHIELSAAERKELFLLVLGSNGGHISEACNTIGVCRQWYYKWLKADNEFHTKVNWLHEARLDNAECCLQDNINGHVSADIKFYLERQGKARGYGRESTVNVGGVAGQPVGVDLYGSLGLGVAYPKMPNTVAEWEAQVKEAKERRRLQQAEVVSNPEQAKAAMLDNVRLLELEEDGTDDFPTI